MSQQALEERVAELEHQVKGLTESVKILWDALGPHALKKQELNDETKIAVSPTKTQVLRLTEDWEKLPPYEYSPLKIQNSEIRLITFRENGDLTGPISCTLKTVSLDNPDEIKALVPLSYTWGSSENTEVIAVDGRPFKVTKNLHAALEHFSRYKRDLFNANLASEADAKVAKTDRGPNTWWVDAICINQNDLDERSSQVSLMTRLYKSAACVAVWLGEKANDSDHAMDMIKELANSSKSLLWTKRPGKNLKYVGPGTEPIPLPDDPRILDDAEKDRNYKAVIDLFKRDWFARVWIRQEVALTKLVVVHCGDKECAWDEMMSAASILSVLADTLGIRNLHRFELIPEGSLVSCFQQAEALQHLRQNFVVPGENGTQEYFYLHLAGILFHARNSKATDSRDKVYAMLPLVNPDDTTVVPNYRLSLLEVYKAVALDMASSSLDFLSACQYSVEQIGIPSWAPDFSRKWKFWPLLSTFDAGKTERITRDFRSDPPQTHYEAETSVLRANGILFDPIDLIHDSYPSVTFRNDELEALKEQWREYFVQNALPLPRPYKYNAANYAYHGKIMMPKWFWSELVNQRELDSMRGRLRPGLKLIDTPYNMSLYTEPCSRDGAAMRFVENQFMTSDYGAEIDESRDVGKARAFLAGRRFGRTAEGAWVFLPAATQLASQQKLCFRKTASATRAAVMSIALLNVADSVFGILCYKEVTLFFKVLDCPC